MGKLNHEETNVDEIANPGLAYEVALFIEAGSRYREYLKRYHPEKCYSVIYGEDEGRLALFADGENFCNQIKNMEIVNDPTPLKPKVKMEPHYQKFIGWLEAYWESCHPNVPPHDLSFEGKIIQEAFIRIVNDKRAFNGEFGKEWAKMKADLENTKASNEALKREAANLSKENDQLRELRGMVSNLKTDLSVADTLINRLNEKLEAVKSAIKK